MTTYNEYFARYKAKIEAHMQPIKLENIPEIHQLGLAMRNLVKVKIMDKDFEEKLQHEYDSLLQAINAQLQAARQDDDDDDDGFLDFIFTVGKIAAIGAVAYFAPALLAETFPTACATGSIGSAVGTGALAGVTDAAAQEVGIGLGLQDHFSANEVLESAVSTGVGGGVTELGTLARAAVVSVAAAGTQGAEMLAGMRDEFDPKAVGLQIAASIIASSIDKVAPDLMAKFGEEGTQIAATGANVALNSVLQSVSNGSPLDISNIAANVVGTISGGKIGETIKSKFTSVKNIPEQNPETKVETSNNKTILPELDFDKLCPVNDTSYLNRPKMTPVQPLPPVNDAIQLMLQGKFNEAKELAIKNGKAQYTPIDQDLKNATNNSSESNQNSKDVIEKQLQNKGSSTADILAKMAQANTGESYSFMDTATPFEKAVVLGLGVTASVAILPEAAIAALNRITLAFATGAITESILLDTFANPVFLQVASRAGILFGDLTLAYKAGFFENKTITPFLKSFPENTIFHTVASAEHATGVLKGINVNVFSTESRFGRALYTSEIPDTTLAELHFHQKTGTHTIRYHFNRDTAHILDLTDPKIAEEWGYHGGEVSVATQAIGAKAKEAGYNVIRFNSERGNGANLAILDNFDILLKPQMVVPVPSVEASNVVALKENIKVEEKVHETPALRL